MLIPRPSLRLPIIIACIAIPAVLSGVGCTRQVYKLELRPDGDSIERTLSVWTETTTEDSPRRSPLSDDELARIRPFYDRANDQFDGEGHTFTGRFQSEMPGDIGGAGTYTFFQSPLGSTSAYSERFRGNDDLKQSMQMRIDAIDKLISLLSEWVNEEFAESPVHDQLVQLIDKEIRRDFENLSLYCWTHSMHSDRDTEQIGKRLLARLVQYFVERDYFKISDLPRVLRVANSEDKQAMAKLLHELVLRKLEIATDTEAASSLEIFSDPDRLESSLRASIEKSELYTKALAEHKYKHLLKNDDSVKNKIDDPLGLLFMYSLQATLPDLFSRGAGIGVMLHCNAEPFATNGTWEDDTNVVTWNDSINARALPTMAFATWSLPNTDAQQKHFGRVILDGEDLAMFALTYQSMDTDESKQFNTFLANLSPEDNVDTKCESLSLGNDERLTESIRSILKGAVSNSNDETVSE